MVGSVPGEMVGQAVVVLGEALLEASQVPPPGAPLGGQGPGRGIVPIFPRDSVRVTL